MRLRITGLLLAAGLAAAAGTAFAQSEGIGAPTSAAGGVHSEPLGPVPGAAGPLDSGHSFGNSGREFSVAPLKLQGDSESIRESAPGTGKFEAPNNAPCIGSTGFGSTDSIPGHKC